MAKLKRLFWDIETSPGIFYAWRCSYRARITPEQIIREPAIICICYKWEDEDDTHSLQWDNGDDRKMVKRFAKVAADADEMVAHNGDRFDLKWFNTRNLLAGLPPIPKYKTVDTLTMARQHFYLQSNRLDYLGQRMFGSGKLPTGFKLWRQVAGDVEAKDDLAASLPLTRDPVALGRMVTYCKNDVLLEEQVWSQLRDYAPVATHEGVFATGNVKMRWTCPYCGAIKVKKSKTKVTASGMLQHQMKCKSCYRYYTIANNVFGWREKWELEQKIGVTA